MRILSSINPSIPIYQSIHQLISRSIHHRCINPLFNPSIPINQSIGGFQPPFCCVAARVARVARIAARVTARVARVATRVARVARVVTRVARVARVAGRVAGRVVL